MDNAGENKALQSRVNSVDWKLNIKVEYTALNTPQENSLAKQNFVLYIVTEEQWHLQHTYQ